MRACAVENVILETTEQNMLNYQTSARLAFADFVGLMETWLKQGDSMNIQKNGGCFC